MASIGGSSNLTQLRYIEETSYAVTPETGNSSNIRNTGDTFAYTQSTTESGEIVSDRMTTDLIVVGAGAAGPFNFELSYKEFDTFLRAVLESVGWATLGASGISTSFGGTFTATTLTADVAPTTTSALTNLEPGQWFQVQANGSANNKKWFRVHSTTAPTATTVTVDPATPFTVDAASKPTKLSASRLKNGVTQTQFTFEREHIDVGQFFRFYGMTVSKFSLSLASGSIVTGSFEFMGKNGDRATATVMPGSPVVSQTYDVMNAVNGVGQILEAGIALDARIKKLDLSVDNSLRAQDAIGTLGAAGVASGSLKVTGTMSVYLKDGTLYDKFVNNTVTSLQFGVKDNAQNGYLFQLPKMKYGDAKVTSGSKDQDCMLDLPFTALKDATRQAAIIIDRLGV